MNENTTSKQKSISELNALLIEIEEVRSFLYQYIENISKLGLDFKYRQDVFFATSIAALHQNSI